MILALAGNQNCGKTTLFNCLTGSNQHVGNFPGVTVEQKSGEMKGSAGWQIVDLPGIYSIRPYTNEEKVTRDFILNEKPDGIINIVDATNIERNLYLTLQLLTLNIPMVLVLNMIDEVRGNGGAIDVIKMSDALGIPVIPVSAAKGEGITDVCDKVIKVVKSKNAPKKLDFCTEGPVHRCIHSVMHIIEDHAENANISKRFAATKIIEGDNYIREKLSLTPNELELIEHSVIEMEDESGLDRNAAIADMQYSFIEKLCARTVVKGHESKERIRSEKIDSILTGKFFAIPAFLVIMLVIFRLSFDDIGGYLSDLLSLGIDAITNIVDKGLTIYGINPVVHSLIIDGIFAGVGSVLSFLPIIVTLFFFLSILEDTGYMARIAFVMDRPLRKIGLSGRSFVPMLIGFGCSVPAIMSSRTLASERDRKITIMLIPFMSCSAKIPIYAVFCAAFFKSYSAIAMMGIYLIGILLAVLVAFILNKCVFRGKPIPFVMELPNYRMPSAKSVLLLIKEKAEDFIKKAFTVIFIATIIIWFLETFDTRLNVVSDSSNSMLASIGKLLLPIFRPIGLNDWRITTSLLSGFTAKEAVVSTMSVLVNTDIASLQNVLPSLFTPLSAVSFLLFSLLYTPCVATVATLRKELKSVWHTIGIVAMQCIIAWVIAYIVYSLGTLLL